MVVYLLGTTIVAALVVERALGADTAREDTAREAKGVDAEESADRREESEEECEDREESEEEIVEDSESDGRRDGDDDSENDECDQHKQETADGEDVAKLDTLDESIFLNRPDSRHRAHEPSSPLLRFPHSCPRRQEPSLNHLRHALDLRIN